MQTVKQWMDELTKHLNDKKYDVGELHYDPTMCRFTIRFRELLVCSHCGGSTKIRGEDCGYCGGSGRMTRAEMNRELEGLKNRVRVLEKNLQESLPIPKE